jgi:hypothetical protein
VGDIVAVATGEIGIKVRNAISRIRVVAVFGFSMFKRNER